jgi:hypothetical protein
MTAAADRPVHEDRTLPSCQPGHDLVDENGLMKRSHGSSRGQGESLGMIRDREQT